MRKIIFVVYELVFKKIKLLRTYHLNSFRKIFFLNNKYCKNNHAHAELKKSKKNINQLI